MAKDKHGNPIKVGDRVRRVDPTDSPSHFGKVGEVYTVLAVESGAIVVIKGRPGGTPARYELVKEEPDMTDEDEIATLEARLDELNKKRAETRKALATTTADLDLLANAIRESKSPKAKTIEALMSLATRLAMLRGNV
jgi:uncharacterized coiled-coil protein SlyX